MSHTTSAKRLAKNSLLMYIRMFILMLISLYTARIVLAQLGIDNFGIYSVVGSVLAMFNSLRSIFSSSTQRFLNYEMGKDGDINRLKDIFNISIKVNLIIVILLLVLFESIGLWFINYKMNVDPSRLQATNIVYQISVLSSLLCVFTTTFDAEIIAHEKMNFFACLSIFEAFLKLGIVFLLSVSPIDKLIFYSLLLLASQLIVFFINILYCRICFLEVRIRRTKNQQYFKEMTKFAGWNFFGNTAYSMTQNVLNMFLNVFGGTVVNAGRGVCYQVKNFFDLFIYNITVVLVPFSIKTYANGERNKFYSIIFFSSKVLFVLQLLASIIVVYFTEDLFVLWLGQIPDYSVEFARLIMIWLLVRALHNPIDTVFKAQGDLKYYQITEICILTLPLLITYLGFKCGLGFNLAFTSMIVCEIVNMFAILLICQNQSDFKILRYLREVLLPCLSVFLIALFFFLLLPVICHNLVHRILLTIVACVCSALFAYYIGLNSDEREYIGSILPKIKQKY